MKSQIENHIEPNDLMDSLQQNDMKAPPEFTCENHNRRRFYVEGLTTKPNGEIFGWSDWKPTLERCAKMLVPSPDAWSMRITGIWDDYAKRWEDDNSEEWQAACFAVGVTQTAHFAN